MVPRLIRSSVVPLSVEIDDTEERRFPRLFPPSGSSADGSAIRLLCSAVQIPRNA